MGPISWKNNICLWNDHVFNLKTEYGKSSRVLINHFRTIFICIHRGSYMSAHVLLNLFNDLGKTDEMRGLPSIFSLFGNKFNKLKNTRAHMLDSNYHMSLRLLWNLISGVKQEYCFHHVITFSVLAVYRFYCMVLFHSQTRSHMIKCFHIIQFLRSRWSCALKELQLVLPEST